ncbi:hypothetical protein EE612_059503 [Oryza sativa]|uniref:Uncharacterized protein n=1 Tax=Oryza sativa subsp. indica TaxID=39946 RepID=B8BPJ7_ORYSI|nr:hypothetical protein OsI_38267 [Oryza sativa Indica Group]KAB8117457.1 hypothetical protein EE612_059503 [Oryza sativa]
MNDTCFAHLSHGSSSNGSELERSEAPLPHGAQKVARNNAAIGCHHHPQLNDGQLLLPRDGRDPHRHAVHRNVGGGGDEAVVVAAERQGLAIERQVGVVHHLPLLGVHVEGACALVILLLLLRRLHRHREEDV